MLTITDFIKFLHKYYVSNLLKIDELQDHTIKDWISGTPIFIRLPYKDALPFRHPPFGRESQSNLYLTGMQPEIRRIRNWQPQHPQVTRGGPLEWEHPLYHYQFSVISILLSQIYDSNIWKVQRQ